MILAEAREENADEAPEPFTNVHKRGDHEEGKYAKVEQEEDISKLFSKAEEDGEVQHEIEDVGEEPPSTGVIMRPDAPKCPSLVVTESCFTCLLRRDPLLRRVIILD